MILIKKGFEPASLTRYKKQLYATYDGLTQEIKDDIRAALLRDQKYICAYCMRRITNDRGKTKIEHWKAQSELSTEQDKLDYKIMLAVCDGCRGSNDKITTCDEHRHNKELYVSPLDSDMMETIYYDINGLIHSKDEQIDEDINKILNLNCNNAPSRIVLNRKIIYKECKERLKKIQARGQYTASTLRKVWTEYEAKKIKLSNSDQYVFQEKEFVGVARYIIKRYLLKIYKEIDVL